MEPVVSRLSLSLSLSSLSLPLSLSLSLYEVLQVMSLRVVKNVVSELVKHAPYKLVKSTRGASSCSLSLTLFLSHTLSLSLTLSL